MSHLGTAYTGQGETEKAIVAWEKALNVSRKLDDIEGEIAAHYELGTYYGHLGDLERALEHHQQALNGARDLGDRSREASFLNNLGRAHLEHDAANRAIKLLNQSLELAREIDNQGTRLYALSNLTIAYAFQEQYGDVGETSEKAEEIDDAEISHMARAESRLKIVRALSLFSQRDALEKLREYWSSIQDSARIFYRNHARVLRARLRLEVEDDAEGTAEDAQKALDFYRKGGVDSRWSREAEEILEKTQAHDTS